MPIPIVSYTVEFSGSKGWEVALETGSFNEALAELKRIRSEGLNGRLTLEFNA